MSFKRFDQEDIVISAESVTTPAWSSNVVELTTFFTSSDQVSSVSGDYYYNIYQSTPAAVSSEIQFSLAYGNKAGAGALLYNNDTPEKSATSTIYGQYRSLVLGDEESEFLFGGESSDHFYVISVDRARYKEKLLPGTLSLAISSSAGSLTLTDNSNTVDTVTFVDAGRVYEIISGSNGVRANIANRDGYSASGSYGKFLPDVGLLILNANALDATAADGGVLLGTQQDTNTANNNITKLYDALVIGEQFKLRAEETISSNFVFVRARNAEFNYSTNPSLITGSGELRHNVMIDTPQAYVTTVGLYNDNNDLLAVAKLSRPLLKDFTKEALVRIKLDY